MHEKEFNIYRERAKKFYERSCHQLFTTTRPLNAEFRRSTEPVKFSDRLDGKYQAIGEGEEWGRTWDSAWFHLTGEIPAEWAGQTVALHLGFGGEALLFDDHGVPYYGLTDGSIFCSEFRKEIFRFSDKATGNEKIDLWIEAAANGLLGMQMDTDPASDCPSPGGHYTGKVTRLRVGILNTELWSLRLDVEILLGMLEEFGPKDYRSARILAALNECINIYAGNADNSAKARLSLKCILELPALASAIRVTGVGHAHIDTGWLWPVRETIRKCARSFANQIYNIDKYPGYVFGASQPQHYAFVKEHYPELYEKIKQRVADGSWELQGGMWVEADCNLISGESMVRQFLHGKNFFMDEFGVDVKNLWIPDVFGYSAAMPQIIRKAGCDYFLTQKISWNQFNQFPYNTFMWCGIDGSEVLTHFPPENTYNAMVSPQGLIRAQNNFNENSFMDEFISLFGLGDGGGGPSEEYIERGLRLADLEGCPKFKFGRADAFFDRIARYQDKLPKWVGELYLELHRGTLTSQARTKRGNRKLEQALAATEFLCSCLPFGEYPAEQFDHAWKVLLINQFHDILPGSSIRKVYEVTEKEHAEQLATCSALQLAAAEQLFQISPDSLVAVNTLSCDYDSPLPLPSSWAGCEVIGEDGRPLPAQTENDSVYIRANIPAMASATFRKGAAIDNTASRSDSLILENDLIRYEFNSAAELLAAYDKEAGRDVLEKNTKGNLLSLYIDQPNSRDAWDVDFFYEQEFIENASSEAVPESFHGAIRQGINFKLSIGNSRISQQISLAAGSKRLDFITEVDWHESRRMLRVSFPVALSVNESSCDIQYGFVKRNTHRNTSWDIAKFEVAAQRYVDLSESSYGVALLNDCKYGHKVSNSAMDLCLLRSPKYPDWDADQGIQGFTYSLLPHTECLEDSRVMHEAACLNRTPLIFDGYCGGVSAPCSLASENVSLEALKKAEKEDCHVIRLVETKGRHSKALLKLANDNAQLLETNLLEWTESVPVGTENGTAQISFTPFEIKTFKIKSAPSANR